MLMLAVSCLLLGVFNPTIAAADEGDVGPALEWLKKKQSADGGFSDGFSPESSISATAEVVIALAAGGETMRDEILRVVPPLLEDGGFIPGCDHGVPPDISWPNFVAYSRLLAELLGWL